MAPTNPFVASQLRQLIFYHFDNDLLQNALFLAGRLYGLDPRSLDTSHLLALCHLKLGQFKAAYEYSKDTRLRGSHLGCAYVFGQACLALEHFQEGITALERCKDKWAPLNHWNKHSETEKRHLPDAAAVLCLLGKLCRGNGETKKAAEYYAESLKLNPFMWDAFLDSCESGVPLQTSNIFKLTDEMRVYLSIPASAATPGDISSQSIALQAQLNSGQNVLNTPAGYDPFNPTRSAGDPGLNYGGPNFMSRLNGSIPPPSAGALQLLDWDTPVTVISNFEDDVMMDDTQISKEGEVPAAPLRKKGTLTSFVSDMMIDAPKMKTMTTRNRPKINGESHGDGESSRPTQLPVSHKRTVSGHVAQGNGSASSDANTREVRRSTRLQNGPGSRLGAVFNKYTESKEKRELPKVRATGTKRATTSTVGRNVSGNRRLEPGQRDIKDSRPMSAASTIREPALRKQMPPPAERPLQEQEALQWLLDLCAKLGEGYYLLSRYRCQQALQILQSVGTSQRETPWVLAQIGRAYYERSAYADAGNIFARIKKIAPSRTEDMEVYSTVLWHLKEEMELAHLSHELIDSDRLSPQAWCALGNSFSLQREHDQAVRCFKRATQLDPKFAYGFTLQGHEHVANEEFDKALHAYRCAISADNRHYNGWYGLGQVYEKLGKWDIAEKHYKSAAQINSTNPVLAVRIGTVLEKMKKTQAALIYYQQGCDLNPRSAEARFMKARALMRLRRPKESLIELEILKDIAPDESMVHFMLGRLYKMIGDKTSAIRHLTIALNLDPKASAHIKDALESLEDEDDEYDEEDLV